MNMSDPIGGKTANNLTAKTTPAETDYILMAENKITKRTKVSDFLTFLKDKLGINTLNTKIGFTHAKMDGTYNNKLGGAYCIYNDQIVFAHITLEIPSGVTNGTLLATFPDDVKVKTMLGIGVSTTSGTIGTINTINNGIYAAGNMQTGYYILDMIFKRA